MGRALKFQAYIHMFVISYRWGFCFHLVHMFIISYRWGFCFHLVHMFIISYRWGICFHLVHMFIISYRWGFCFHLVHVYYIMQMGILLSPRSYAKWFHSCMYMKMTKYFFFNLRHTMFNVHKVTFRYIRILPNFTIEPSIYIST